MKNRLDAGALPAIAAVSIIAITVRLLVAFSGGIWADEGLVMNILTIPTTREMIEFLARHESHPPLFYLATRAWQRVTGTSDQSMLVFICAIGATIVPMTYFAGRRLFSHRTAILASLLVAITPSLVDHGSQIRPYGLLPILVLASASSLIVALQGNVRAWVAWSVATAALLYTHNWTWLVFGGEIVAALVVIVRDTARKIPRLSLLIGATLLIAIMYSPWASALIYQVEHAGHTAPPLNSLLDRLLFVILGVFTIPYHLLLALYPPRVFSLIALAAAAAMVIVIVYSIRPDWFSPLRSPTEMRPPGERPRSAILILLVTPAAALLAALLMSPRSNLLLERCVAMLAPLVILVVSQWIARATDGSSAPLREATGFAAGGFLIVLFVANLVVLWPTRRSNAREVAARVSAAATGTDLLLVVPEWFAPSFNHYFPPSLEQYDYPHPGRSFLLDFADVRTRAVDTSAIVDLRARIHAARSSHRRVWLITSRRYLNYIDNELPKLTVETQRNRYTSVLRLKEAKDALTTSYGKPDTSFVVTESHYRNEDIVPLLFTVDSSRAKAF